MISSARGARRLLIVAVAAITLLALAVGPALAGGGAKFATVDRGFAIDGARDQVAIVAKVAKAGAGAGMQIGVGLGEDGGMDSVAVVFAQDGAKLSSRGVFVYGFSPDFKGIKGAGCTNNSILECEYKKFDWAEGHPYRVAFTRGDQNTQGWLWSVSVTDVEAKKTTKLVTFRSPSDKLNSQGLNGVSVYSSADKCGDLPAVVAAVKKPAAKGSQVSWGKIFKHSDCPAATLAAPIKRGTALLTVK